MDNESVISYNIDLAVANLCLQYKRDCEINDFPKKYILKFLDFRINIAEKKTVDGEKTTISASSDDDEFQPIPKKNRLARSPLPFQEKRDYTCDKAELAVI